MYVVCVLSFCYRDAIVHILIIQYIGTLLHGSASNACIYVHVHAHAIIRSTFIAL